MIDATGARDSHIGVDVDQESDCDESTATEESLLIGIDQEGYYHALPLTDVSGKYRTRLIFSDNVHHSAIGIAKTSLSKLARKFFHEAAKVALPTFILTTLMFTTIGGANSVANIGILSVALCVLLGVAFVLLVVFRPNNQQADSI
ncbi:hypothetical protein [Candidatus Ichthyocystis hellenicum]|uniref:hypothetical protein n=1 Tax=Candidatus Ichthyocystis hellenicum TaxID=1561003 RepID=UPI000B837234|nr:hypothetical protein [Candidatus Ichthyocystis hellenicum]